MFSSLAGNGADGEQVKENTLVSEVKNTFQPAKPVRESKLMRSAPWLVCGSDFFLPRTPRSVSTQPPSVAKKSSATPENRVRQRGIAVSTAARQGFRSTNADCKMHLSSGRR